MKKLLFFICFGLMMLTTVSASPTRDVAKTQSDVAVFAADAQPEIADFVFVSYDMDMNAIAPEVTHVYYEEQFADLHVQVFDFSQHVFRLCSGYSHNMYSQKSLNYTPAYMIATARHVKV